MARTPARIGIVDLKRETGTSASDIPARLAQAGVQRGVDKKWPRAAAVKALTKAKSLPHMVAKRARGKVGGVITNEEMSFLSADEALGIGEFAEDAPGKNIFAANVSSSISAMTEAKTASELERVRKLRLDNDRAEGKLIARQTAVATARDIATRARSALLPLGRKLAPMLNGLTDEIEISSIIESEIRHALASLANPDTFSREVVR